jgi:DNA-binding transcriptional ArsR family regulator
MFRQGVVAVLAAAGYAVDTPSDVVRWASRRSSSCVLLSIGTGLEWTLLESLSAEPSAAAIALLDDMSAAAGARAVRAGARSVLPRVLPGAVTTFLAAAEPPDTPVSFADRVVWLRHLAAGGTVTELADRLGYSERAMYRLLRTLYRDMGVRTRIEAVLRAQDADWV